MMVVNARDFTKAGVDYVLTKPVLEPAIRGMLTLADERRKKARLSPPPDTGHD